MIIYFYELINVFIYFLFSGILATIMISLANFFAPNYLDVEKISAYECGFEPFTSARFRFDITFSTIAILYLIFDLEIVFVLPWVVNAVQLGFLGFITVLIFLVLLMIGFLIEWMWQALDWHVLQ